MDHSLSIKPYLLTQSAAAEDSFNEFVAWCDRSEACALHARDVGAVYDTLMHRAEAGTLVDPERDIGLTWFDLSDHAYNAFYGQNWSGLATWLDSLDRSTPSGTAPAPTPRAPGAVKEPPLPVVCGDWSFPVDCFSELSRSLNKSRKAAPHLSSR